MGDPPITGKPWPASYSAYRSGHALNNKLLRERLSQKSAYELVTFDNEKEAPAGFAQPVRAW